MSENGCLTVNSGEALVTLMRWRMRHVCLSTAWQTEDRRTNYRYGSSEVGVGSDVARCINRLTAAQICHALFFSWWWDLLSVQSDVNTFHSSDFDWLDSPIDSKKNNNGHPFRYSKQAVSFLLCYIWLTIGFLVYILQHSLCMDPGELSWFPESRISNEPSTHLIFQDSGETHQLFLVRETQNDFTMSLVSRDV